MVGLQNASHHDAVKQLQMKAVGALFVVGCEESGVGQRLKVMDWRSGKQPVRRHARNGCLHRQFSRTPLRQRCGIKSSNVVELLRR